MNLWHKNSSPASAFLFPIALQAKVTGAYESQEPYARLKQFVIYAEPPFPTLKQFGFIQLKTSCRKSRSLAVML
jgi:hypothetical protein